MAQPLMMTFLGLPGPASFPFQFRSDVPRPSDSLARRAKVKLCHNMPGCLCANS